MMEVEENTSGGEEVCPLPAMRGEVEVTSRQTVGKWTYYLTPEVDAVNYKVGSALEKPWGADPS